MKIIHLYNDDSGESHLADVELLVEERSAGGTDWSRFAPRFPVTGFEVREVVRENDRHELHTPPRRQLVVMLTGTAEVETSDGSRRVIGAGDVLFVEDLHGVGHRFRGVTGPRVTALLPVAPDFDLSSLVAGT